MIVVDTGPLVAAAIADDRYHAACIELFGQMHAQNRELLVPAPVPAEVGYMLHRLGGSKTEAAFLRSIRDGVFTVVSLTTADWDRMADLVDTYSDLPLGMADASVVAVAERLKVAEVATLDQRHFRIVRPRHVSAFALLPG